MHLHRAPIKRNAFFHNNTFFILTKRHTDTKHRLLKNRFGKETSGLSAEVNARRRSSRPTYVSFAILLFQKEKKTLVTKDVTSRFTKARHALPLCPPMRKPRSRADRVYNTIIIIAIYFMQ